MDKSEACQTPAANIDSWNRTLCSVLEEMRECYKTRNFASLPGLIEEAQTYGNRMECKLRDVKEYNRIKERYKDLQKKVHEMEEKTGANEQRQPRDWRTFFNKDD